MGKYRTLILDIENSANLGYTWNKYETDVIAFVKEWYMLSFAYKWHDEDEVHGYCLPDFPSFKKDHQSDEELVKKLWGLLNEADLVVGHNVIDFDLRKASSRFLYWGLNPPSPVKTVDTLKIARKRFMLNSNKLGDLAQYLGVGEKMETGGFNLWKQCWDGDTEAFEKMLSYNKQDVAITAKVYDRLAPWHPNHPNITLASGESYLCPSCGSNQVQRRGLAYLQSFTAQRYICKGCGRWSTGKREKIPQQLLKSV